MKRALGFAVFVGAAAMSSFAVAAPPDDGCPTGAPDTFVPSLDFTSYTATFSGIQEGSGGVARCSFWAPVLSGSTGTLIVYSADYRGTRTLAGGSKATLDVQHDGISDGETFNGPIDDLGSSVTYHTGVVTNGGEGTIRSTVTLDLSQAGDGGDFGSLDSIDYAELGRVTLPGDEISIVTHLGASTGLLTGSDKPLEGPDEVGLVGGVGSAMFGVTAHYNISEGFSLLGGASLVTQTTDAGTPYGGIVAAGAARYVEPGEAAFRMFVEGGGSIAGLGATFSPNSGSTVTGTLGVSYAYGRGGVLLIPDTDDELALSATLQETLVAVGAFDLWSGPLAASIPGQTGRFTTIKGTAAWTRKLLPQVDFTATASVGAVLAHDGVSVDIDSSGPPETLAAATPGTTFVEYGLRVGWELNSQSRIDGFIQGSATTNLGSHTQIGAGYSFKF